MIFDRWVVVKIPIIMSFRGTHLVPRNLYGENETLRVAALEMTVYIMLLEI